MSQQTLAVVHFPPACTSPPLGVLPLLGQRSPIPIRIQWVNQCRWRSSWSKGEGGKGGREGGKGGEEGGRERGRLGWLDRLG